MRKWLSTKLASSIALSVNLASLSAPECASVLLSWLEGPAALLLGHPPLWQSFLQLAL